MSDPSHDAELALRIAELEARVAFQADTIATLDEVVCDFAMKVTRLEAELARVESRLLLLGDEAGEIGPADDPPPHY